MKHLKQLFLNEKFILGVILLNAVVIYLQVKEITSPILTILDVFCTAVFLVEMIVKHKELGLKGYWSSVGTSWMVYWSSCRCRHYWICSSPRE